MPFTLSHPAAVLPLLRGGRGRGPLLATGLVAGSLAPDVPFYAESVLRGTYRFGELTHRWWAVPTVDVVVAGGLAAGWHRLLREPLVSLLPASWAAAAETVTAGGAGRAVGWFAVSAGIGAATHVGWDAWTHEGRAGVRAFPVLTRRVVGVPLYDVLQYGGSAVALAEVVRYTAALLAAERAQAQEQEQEQGLGQEAAPLLRGAGVAALGLGAALGVVHRLRRRRGRARLDEICFGAGAGLVVGATGHALAVRLLVRCRNGP
ncbi:DUF4184 family protein [Saccharothrix sp. ST-888]|uniref:DUF4184 family protein n=1 Tax=Saccharothrix sp. ST-888 TaxID=1427391 RepID=UPI0005ED2677|nr:DUF4184 family protein [Saccharothrix sp. ST-888]